VTLTGTDIYGDLARRPRALAGLARAWRIVVLQPRARAALPAALRPRTRVIFQSATPPVGAMTRPRGGFRVAVIGHLRPIKDPFRAALASRRLPAASHIRIVHIGRAVDASAAARARAEMRANARYLWLGALPFARARRLAAASHLVVISSRAEGSSNVLSEALAADVPVLCARIPGLLATLGPRYPGTFPCGDTRALAELLDRAERDARFYERLRAACGRVAPLVRPARERAAWAALLGELAAGRA
jgi:glycosyltransferase involved in cell wall biosynthesis